MSNFWGAVHQTGVVHTDPVYTRYTRGLRVRDFIYEFINFNYIYVIKKRHIIWGLIEEKDYGKRTLLPHVREW